MNLFILGVTLAVVLLILAFWISQRYRDDLDAYLKWKTPDLMYQCDDCRKILFAINAKEVRLGEQERYVFTHDLWATHSDNSFRDNKKQMHVFKQREVVSDV